MGNYTEAQNILKSYRTLKAEIKRLQLDIEALNSIENIGLISSSGDMAQLGQPYAYSDRTGDTAAKTVDKVNILEAKKAATERQIERIDNALTVLDQTEFEVLNMRYLQGLHWDIIVDKMNLTYPRLNQIEHKAVHKIEPLLINYIAA